VARYAKYETWAFWVGGYAVSDREIGFPFDELLSSVAPGARTAIIGIESELAVDRKMLTDC
jgi:hypothetical protein